MAEGERVVAELRIIEDVNGQRFTEIEYDRLYSRKEVLQMIRAEFNSIWESEFPYGLQNTAVIHNENSQREEYYKKLEEILNELRRLDRQE